MKAILALLCLSSLAFAQDYHPLRVVGTNVVDLSLVYQAMRNPNSSDGWHNRYVARGKVETIGRNSITLYQTAIRFKFVGNSAITRYGDSGDLLSMVAARQVTDSGGSIGYGQYLAMSPMMRSNFEQVQVKTRIQVKNYDGTKRSVESEVALVALPTASGFNYGEVLNTDPTGRYRIKLIVGSEGFRSEKIVTIEEREAIELNAARLQMRDATNGSAFAQYELGKRYLDGRGVQKDHLLALHWLKSAKTNTSYESVAERALKQIQIEPAPDPN